MKKKIQQIKRDLDGGDDKEKGIKDISKGALTALRERKTKERSDWW